MFWRKNTKNIFSSFWVKSAARAASIESRASVRFLGFLVHLRSEQARANKRLSSSFHLAWF